MVCILDISVGCIPRNKIAQPKDIRIFFKTLINITKMPSKMLVPISIPTINRECYTVILNISVLMNSILSLRSSLQVSLSGSYHSLCTFKCHWFLLFQIKSILLELFLNLINANKMIHSVHFHSYE